jgi:hypothetical protein
LARGCWSALAPATANIKSQDPVALERRLKRLRANPDYHYLCRAKDTRIAELEKYVEENTVLLKQIIEAKKATTDALLRCAVAHDARRRSAEGFAMKCEEAFTYHCEAKEAEEVMLEEARGRCLAEMQLENLKRKRNPGRTGGGKRGRPKKIAAKSVFVDDELTQLGPPDYSLMEAD